MPTNPNRTTAQIIRQSIKRAEIFFPGSQTVLDVHHALTRNEADVDSLTCLLQLVVQVTQEIPSPPFTPPYDSVLDQALKARGWSSLRDQPSDNHIHDMWTWPQTAHLWNPTMIHHEGKEIRVFYAISPPAARSPQLVFANAADLLEQISFIEAWR